MEQVERAARRWRLLVAAAALGWSVSPQAAETQCPEQFWKRAPPQLLNSKLASETRQICYHGYAVLHSGLTRTPLWSAEHLTRERIEAAHGLVRENLFHPDPNLPPRERAELSDYARSGFDRGHMAPSGDMPTSLSQDESFSFANMIPQNPDNNRHLWSELEGSVRDLTEHDGELYVITGPIFDGDALQSLNGRVLVPTRIFKAVYDPTRNRAGVYITANSEGAAGRRSR